MGVKTMKKRIFSGAVCEQLVYNVPSGVKDPMKYDPEKPSRKRFKDEKERKEHREAISLRKFIRIINENHNPESIYSTLTFKREWEVHTFEEAKQVRRNFIRVLTHHYPAAVIHLVMGRGRSAKRIHFHMISKGIPMEFIKKKWKYGDVVDLDPLRKHNWYQNDEGTWVDHGQDYTAIATYMWKHWTEEQGGHRWFQTKNVREPEAEKPTEVRKTGGYSEKRPPVAPKGYKLVETKTTKYGYLYFKYVVIPPEVERKKPKKKTGQGTG
jgi:hypothetical protein